MIILYDEVETGHTYLYSEEGVVWKIFVESRYQAESCCDDMRSCYDHLHREDHIQHRRERYDFDTRSPEVGLHVHSYEDVLFYEFKHCPFCGEALEYRLRKRFRMVEKALVKVLALEEIQ